MNPLFKILFASLFSLSNLLGQLPTPSEVSTQVSSLWINNEINQLDQYITGLIADNPNYVPALLAASFHESVFEGKLANAKSKLISIKSDADLNSGKYSEQFVEALTGIIRLLENEIAMHARHGVSNSELESNASASTVRSVWGTTLLPQIRILEIADSVSI